MTTAKTDALRPEYRAISETLVDARSRARALSGFPGTLPDTLEAAYDIQDASRERWPQPVAGWKVGGVPPVYLDTFDDKWLVGPIYADTVVRAHADKVARMPVFAEGFAAIEPEFLLCMGAEPAQDRLFIGAEIASSPIPAINDVGPVAVICDFGNNRGMLIGPEVRNWQEAAIAVRVETIIDGKSIGVKELDDLREGVARSRNVLTDMAQRRGFDLPEGTYISCGAITGVHEAAIGARSTLDFAQLGSVDLELVTAGASG